MLQDLVSSALRPRSRPAGLRPPPRLSGGLPALGHTAEFLKNPLLLLTRAHRELGEVAGLQIGPKRVTCLFGPGGHEAVFRAPDDLLNPAEAYAFMTPIFGKGLVYDATPEVMGEQVKMLLPALKDRRMRTYTESIVREVEDSIASWGDEGVFDLAEYCRVLTNFTSSRCLMGPEFRESMNEEFAAIYHALERGITPLAYLNANLPLPVFRRRDQARVRLVGLVRRIVEERRRKGTVGEDFLQTLMEARYSDGRALTEDEITGLLVTAMFAGHHTSSVTTAWTLLEALRDRAYLARMNAQIDEVLAGGAAVTMQTAREITLTDYAVRETLRMHPPLFMLIRVAQADWSYQGYDVPRGDWVIVSPTVSHLSERWFKAPQRFDPLRFSPEREGEITDWSYVPFGGGRHKCLGNAFALLQVKTILAILLSRYEFDLHGDAILDDYQSTVIGPKEPCRLRYRRRVRAGVAVPARAAAAVPASVAGVAGVAAPAAACPFHQAPSASASATTSTSTSTAASAPAVGRMRILIDRDLCQGHAVCTGEAPEVFDIGADGKVSVKVAHPGPELHERVRRAEQFCPNGTIQVVME